MKKIASFLAVFFTVAGSFAQVTEQKISDKVTISFPGKPTLNNGENGAVVYTLIKDSSTAYMAVSVDLGALGLSADMIASAGDAVWEQMKGPMMSKLPNAVLVKDQVTTFKGKSALYMEIDGAKSAEPLLKGKKTFGYSFFVGAILTNLTYYSASPTATVEDAKAFFDSVVITN